MRDISINQQIFHQLLSSPMNTSHFNTNHYHFCTLNETQFIKPLPSLNFVQKLIDICQPPPTLFDSQQRNRYDRKNHILYINNFAVYEQILKEKYGRSVGSFQKQLKMMGFKRRKVRQHNVIQEIENSNLQSPQHYQTTLKSITYSKQPQPQSQKYILVWKTNRPKLIEQSMQDLQKALQEQIERVIRMKENIERSRKELDRKLECVLLSGLTGWFEQQEGDTSMVQGVQQRTKHKQVYPLISHNQFSTVIQQLRTLSNSTKQSATSLIKQISKISQSQLQLYRTLISKQTTNTGTTTVEQQTINKHNNRQ